MLLTCPVHKGCRRRFFVLPSLPGDNSSHKSRSLQRSQIRNTNRKACWGLLCFEPIVRKLEDLEGNLSSSRGPLCDQCLQAETCPNCSFVALLEPGILLDSATTVEGYSNWGHRVILSRLSSISAALSSMLESPQIAATEYQGHWIGFHGKILSPETHGLIYH